PFTELSVETQTKAAWGNQTLDEWSLSGTNSGTLRMPTGETVPATGRRVTVRGADVCTVEGEVVVEHHVYYDQAELFGQLGVLPE
ncbi:MAG: ester cyclase, partial [Acidimicrobiales bacterium]